MRACRRVARSGGSTRTTSDPKSGCHVSEMIVTRQAIAIIVQPSHLKASESALHASDARTAVAATCRVLDEMPLSLRISAAHGRVANMPLSVSLGKVGMATTASRRAWKSRSRIAHFARRLDRQSSRSFLSCKAKKPQAGTSIINPANGANDHHTAADASAETVTTT